MRYINYIKDHKFFVASICLFALVLYLLCRYSLLIVNSQPGNAPEKLLLTGVENDSREKILRNGINIVRRGSYTLRATKDEMKTTVYPKISLFRIESTYISFEKQKEIEKITPNQTEGNCLFGNTARIYVYCSNGKLFKRQAGDLLVNEPYLREITILGEPSPYRDGILSFVTIEGTNEEEDNYIQFVYISMSGISTIEKRASKFVGSSFGKISVYDDRFLITNDITKNFYYFLDYKKTPVKYFFANDAASLNNASDITGVLGEETITITYNGRPPYKEVEFNEQKGNLFALTYAAGDKLTKNSNSRKVGNILGDNIGVLKDGKLIAFYDYFSRVVTVFNITDFKVELKIPNIDLATISDNNIYYTQAKTLYRYDADKKSSYLMRESDLVTDSLLTVKDGVLFTGSHNTNLASSSTYFSSKNELDKVSVDAFSLAHNLVDDLPVISFDYSSNSVLFAVLLDSALVDRGTGKFTYNKDEYSRKKSEIIEKLQQAGLDIGSYKLYFKAGP